jgi:splicing factor 3B subunit 4
MQILDAMAPFIQSGIIDLQKLAQYVLQYGFGVKQPSMFMSSAPPPQSEPAGPPEQMEQMPQGMPQGMPPMPPQGMAPQGLPPEAMMQGGPPVGGPPPGLPPELAQLPPELLMQLLQGGGIPEGMPPGMPPGM